MMKLLRLKLERLLPFLAVPRLDVPGDTSAVSGTIPPEALQPDASYSHLELRGVRLVDRELRGVRLYRAALDSTTFQQVDLEDCRLLHSRLRECRLEQVRLAGARWTIVDAEGCTLHRCSLQDAELAGVSLRDGVLEEVDLSGSTITLADLFGARLCRVKAEEVQLTGVDLSYASLEEVDFTGADLRGCNFSYALFQNVKLTGARVEDADLRGVRGLSKEARIDLRRRGARLRTGLLERAIGAVLERMRPELAPDRVDVLAVRGSLGAKLLGLVLVALGTAQLFWGNQEVLGPPPHGSGETPETAGAAVRTPTDEELEKTKANLNRLRQAIQDAYTTSSRYGVARYPTLEDLTNNEFDRDGMGPGTDRLPLVPGGLPQNFLTGGEGVAPYCNDPASQATLTGDDTDWHYCEETGRIYACGGFTTALTLDW